MTELRPTPQRAKLTARKEQWAADGRQPTRRPANAVGGTRTPPGQHVVQTFPVLDLGHQPAIDHRDWSLRVGGHVRNPITWDWTQFERQRKVRRVSDIHCVTAWSRFDNRWEGMAFRDLLSVVEPLESARFVYFKSYDSYMTNLPLSHVLDDDILLATHWEGEPLTREHGGPVRIVLPKLYFWKSAKWIRQIWFSDADSPGFWEARGYHPIGNPWQEERYGA
ncbi:MAG: sulfite oxidase-like oxidoreductase [Pseudomonadota bacterium]